jgi:hypothetical protein
VFVVNARGQDALLKNDPLELVNTQCLPGAQCVNCIARLGQDIGCVIPYLDAALGDTGLPLSRARQPSRPRKIDSGAGTDHYLAQFNADDGLKAPRRFRS